MDIKIQGETRKALSPEERRIRLKKLKRKRRFRLAIVIAGFFLILSLVIDPIIIFAAFRIKSFRVEGEIGYSEEQIIEASGLKEGDGLLFANLEEAAAAIEKSLPYADKVKLTKKLPDEIVVRLEETSKTLAVETSRGDYALTNSNLKTLEFSKTVPDGLTLLVGAAPTDPLEGTVLTFSGDENGAKFATIEKIIGAITENEIKDVTFINAASSDAIYLIYQDRVVWRLGDSTNLASKLSLGKRAMGEENKLSSTQFGTLNLTIEKKAYFNRAEFEDIKELVEYEKRRAPAEKNKSKNNPF